MATHRPTSETDVLNVTAVLTNTRTLGVEVQGPTWLVIVLIFLATTSISGNLVVLITVSATKQLRTLNYVFIISLVLTDLVMGGFVTIPMVYHTIQPSNFQHAQCMTLGVAFQILSKMSTLSAVAVSYDRYKAVVHCLQYSGRCQLTYAIKGLAAVLTTALLFSVLPLIGWGHLEYDQRVHLCTVSWSYDPAYSVFTVTCCFLLPVMVMIVSYCQVTKIARQHLCRIADINAHVHNLHRQESGSGSGSREDTINISGALAFALVDPIRRLSLFPTIRLTRDIEARQLAYMVTTSTRPREQDDKDSVCNVPIDMNIRKLRSTGRLVRLVGVLLICWLPYYTVAICETAGHSVSQTVMAIVHVLALASSSLNPVVYAFCSRRFRKALVRMCKQSRRPPDPGPGNNVFNLYTTFLARGQDAPVIRTEQASEIQNANPGPSRFICDLGNTKELLTVPSLHVTLPLPERNVPSVVPSVVVPDRRLSEDSAYCDWSRRTSDTSAPSRRNSALECDLDQPKVEITSL